MGLSIPIQRAARILRSGGVVAYPTEGVFGLGCMPADAAAVIRILSIKKRDPALGLVLIAAHTAQLAEWAELNENTALASSSERPVTWIVPARPGVPYWITGDNAGVAVRVTTHPVARSLCEAADSALVSTSANIAGHPPIRNAYVLRRLFGRLVDCIIPGRCGPASGPSEIRDLATGRILRSGQP